LLASKLLAWLVVIFIGFDIPGFDPGFLAHFAAWDLVAKWLNPTLRKSQKNIEH
jgi:hypothetical protein